MIQNQQLSMSNLSGKDKTHFSSSDIRATLPWSFHQTNLQGDLKLEKMTDKLSTHQSKISEYSSCSAPQSFFVRVAVGQLQEQNRIYKWRMNCSENFIGISSIKVQSQGNQFNPNVLFKVDMAVSKSNFIQVKDLCLTKCASLMRSMIKGILTLLEYFQPVIFTDKMAYLTDYGSVKVWVDDRFYINPHNSLYNKSEREVSLEESVRSVVEIFQLKCLKTKLSHQFFRLLHEANSFVEVLYEIDTFEKRQSLFPIQGLKVSVSTGYALGSSSNLQFSTDNLKKKKIGDKIPEKCGNLAKQRKFLQAKSMQINSDLLSPKKLKQKNNQQTYHSQHQVIQQQNNNTNLVLQQNPQKPSTSIVISEMFQSDNDIGCHQIKKPSHDEKFSHQSAFSVDPFKSRKLQIVESDSDSEEKEQRVFDQMINQNGWSANLTSLFDQRDMKQSFAEGKEEKTYLQGFKLKKLQTMGKEVYQSFLRADLH